MYENFVLEILTVVYIHNGIPLLKCLLGVTSIIFNNFFIIIHIGFSVIEIS